MTPEEHEALSAKNQAMHKAEAAMLRRLRKLHKLLKAGSSQIAGIVVEHADGSQVFVNSYWAELIVDINVLDKDET
jgi:hypothetical protein